MQSMPKLFEGVLRIESLLSGSLILVRGGSVMSSHAAWGSGNARDIIHVVAQRNEEIEE